MILCPVCEHSQAQGAECERCGKQLVVVKVPDLPVAVLPDLEITKMAGTDAPVQVMPLQDIEITKLAAGPDLPVQQVQDMESTHTAPVNVHALEIDGLEQHRLESNPAERTRVPEGPIACRYCGTPGLPGSFCDGCGKKHASFVQPGARDAKGGFSKDAAPMVRHACGVLTRALMNCSSCGVFVEISEQ